jgi:hypothetical protein
MKIRTAAAILATPLVIAAAVALPATPAFAAATGELVIQLVTPSHAPVKAGGINVILQERTGSKLTYSTGGMTDSNGQLPIGSLPPSSKITIWFDAQQGFVEGTTSGIKLASGQTRSVNLVAAQGASVSGTVTEGQTPTPLAGAHVSLLNSKGAVEADAATDGSGNYSITGVSSGSYRVEFNSRFEQPNSAAAQNFTWSYWDGVGKESALKWTSAKTITLKQQSSHSGATAAIGLGGQAFENDVVRGTVSYWSPESSHAGQRVEFVAQHAADSFTTELGSDGNLSVQVNPGKYKIAIMGDYDTILAVTPYYWYVSDTHGPATSESKASWVTVDVATKRIAFVPVPNTRA